MATTVEEVVVGSSRKNYMAQIVDDVTGQGINVAGGSARLQGKTGELPAIAVGGCSTTSGSPTLGRAAGDFNADGVKVGFAIAGPNVPDQVTVLAIPTATTITMGLDGVAVNATGTGSSLAMTFTPAIDRAGTVSDAPNGFFTWAGLGDFVTAAVLAAKEGATYNLRVKFKDAAGKQDSGELDQIRWVRGPL